MNSRRIWKETAEKLREAEVPDPEYDSGMILAAVTGRNHLSLRLGEEITLSPKQETALREFTDRRRKREPLQYILGTVFFRGMELRVSHEVLIPRPETEMLAEWALEKLSMMHSPGILDLCCGSGCLGLSLSHDLPDASVTLSELSPGAISIACENRNRLGLRAEILEGDLFVPVAGRKFDCIVSNPPYIPSEECGVLQPEVLREPMLALDGGTDGLDFYRRIAVEAPAHLKKGGFLMMEVGQGEAAAVAELLKKGGAEATEIRMDFSRIERMVYGSY